MATKRAAVVADPDEFVRRVGAGIGHNFSAAAFARRYSRATRPATSRDDQQQLRHPLP